jgi:two-component system CheB/CheR fusion protein
VETDGLGDQQLALEWVESGIVIDPSPQRSGFGRELLERALRFTLRAQTTLTFAPTGVRCRITLPLRALKIAHPSKEEAST